MLFLNMMMLAGVAGLSIPIILHILNRRQSKLMEWGAMKFLLDSLASRRRNILLEEVLLLATRCLIVALLALAMARPFATANSQVPWGLVLPCGLLAVVLFGVSFALWNYPAWRKRVQWTALALALITAGFIAAERWLMLKRFGGGNTRDIALVIDGSSSMTIEVNGESNFTRAVKEAKDIIESAPRGVRFSLIVSGGVPNTLVQTPTNDRRFLLRALAEAQPMQGTMRAPETLAAATLSLTQGNNLNKQIIVIGDGQAVGWNLGDDGQWSFMRDIFAKLAVPPQVIWRRLPMPANVRNLTLSRIDFSRDVIGTDRQVRIDVTVDNTGVEGVTPQQVSLTVEERTYTDHSLGQLEPGTSHTISFWHRFARPGTHAVTANVDAADELPADDTALRVAHVIGTLRVLIVEGAAGGNLSQRPGGFLALSLMPDRAGLQAGGARSNRFLVSPELMSVAEFAQLDQLDGVAVVVLADVPKLSERSARAVADFTEAGGGLMVINGPRSDAEFFNNWQTDAKNRVMPLTLDIMLYPEGTNRVSIKADSAAIDSVKNVLTGGDLDTVALNRYWKSHEADATAARVGMTLDNGDAFIAENACGQGTVLQLLTGLDAASGNLAARHTFLPMMHELVYHLARPYAVNLNVPPSLGLSLMLAGGAADATTAPEGGLRGRYFSDKRFRRVAFTRIDPALDFAWNGPPAEKMPAENFTVRWDGVLTVPVSGEYTFHATVDDRMRVSIAKRHFNATYENAASYKMRLEEGTRYPVQVDMEQDGGPSGAKLEWEGPGIPRQVVPSRFFTPGKASVEDIGPRTETRAQAPDGSHIWPYFVVNKGGIILRVDGSVLPGLYQVDIPASMQAVLSPFADAAGKLLFYVLPDAQESVLATLDDDETSFFSRYIPIMAANSFEDMQRAVKGNAFGREFWRILAVAMFLLLVAEPALTRWIAMQRKTGEEGRVTFDDALQPSATFREQVEKLKGGQA